MKLIRAAELAEQWNLTEDELHRRRRRNGWPCVKLARDDVRFTEEHVAQIVALQSTPPRTRKARKSGGTGQSKRSASRT